MSARRPLQPLSPLAGNVVGAKYNYTFKGDADIDELSIMDDLAEDGHSQPSGSIASNLTDLENEADDFERLMIQNARDERRLNNALHGKLQPFRKARTHPRVALTMGNLEMNEERNDGALHAKAQVKFESPPSSSGSARSDPAIQPPSGWGRKGRVRRDWLRTAITSDDDQKPGAQDDTIDRLTAQEDLTLDLGHRTAYTGDADLPVASVEDSPLSRKSSHAGTPSSTRRRREALLDTTEEWGKGLDFNEASMIASTPYIPSRNTMLEDIRHREIESLREQAVTTNRLDKIRESSPEETRRRPRSSSAHSTNNQTNGASTTNQPALGASVPELRLRKRTNSWKTIGRSQVVTEKAANEGAQSPMMVYSKSTETVGIVNPDLVANAPTSPKRPTHQRDNSHDLLRRLARASSVTPSPGRNSDLRPNTAPARQPGSSSRTVVTEITSPSPKEAPPLEKTTQQSTTTDTMATAPSAQVQRDEEAEKPGPQESAPNSNQEPETVDIDATPIPIERSIVSAKTPVVTGAWIDTPAPRASFRPLEPSQPRSRSPRKGSPGKRSPTKAPMPQPEEATPEPAPIQVHRPHLPSSALSAIVEEAKSSSHRPRPDDFGDSTINSLEDLITPGTASNSELDEDTLLGLKLPTAEPRNEAERQRQQELLHLHKMNERLKAARHSIRDTSRGMKRIEDRVEHAEGSASNGNGIATAASISTETVVMENGVRTVYKEVYRDCPCAHGGHQCVSVWTSFKRLLRDRSNPSLAKRWGFTWLGLVFTGFLIWFVMENLACEAFCHAQWAPTMNGYGVDEDAPRYPIVIPTLFYRTFIEWWWPYVWAPVALLWRSFYGCCLADWWNGGAAEVVGSATQTVTRAATRVVRDYARTVASEQETWASAGSMYDDEVI